MRSTLEKNGKIYSGLTRSLTHENVIICHEAKLCFDKFSSVILNVCTVYSMPSNSWVVRSAFTGVGSSSLTLVSVPKRFINFSSAMLTFH